MPAGALLTLPLPVPLLLTESATDASNTAVTTAAPLTVTVQGPVPAHAPPQPTQRELASGVALRDTTAPPGYVPEQLAPHVMPGGELSTRPFPSPIFITARRNIWGVRPQASLEYSEYARSLKARTR